MSIPLFACLTILSFLLPTAATAQPTLAFPPRPTGALTGSQFYAEVQNMTRVQREAAVLREAKLGNVPNFYRTLIPVTVSATINSVPRTGTIYVAPDYFAIGSDQDFFRMPTSATLAQQLANLADANLPTRKMVNDIYTAATVKLAPHPFTPDATMTTAPVFWASHNKIEEQRLAHQNGALGNLIGGTKKDVVVTPQLNQRPPPPRVAIYGWHQLNGSPIQGLSLVHEETYVDYSHGVRLIAKKMLIDNVEHLVPSVIAHATLHPLLTDEGANTVTAYPVPEPQPENLVINGSFETFPTSGIAPNWASWQATGSVTISFGRAGVNKVDGLYSQYWNRNDTTAFDGGVYQRVVVPTGRLYRIQASIKRQSTLNGTLSAFGYDRTGGTAPLAAGVVWTDLTGSTNDVWVPYISETHPATTAITLFARGKHTGGGTGTNSYFYLDAVSMTGIGPAPSEQEQMISAFLIK